MRERDIAIVGMACRFPKAPDLGGYWRNIRGAKVCFSEIPKDRWNHELFYHPGAREIDKSYARKVGFIDDVWSFAAMHYGLAPLRVKVTDPQHRLLLDCVRTALEDAGYEAGARTFPRGATGVFVGASVSEHKDILTGRLRVQQLLDGQYGRVPRLPPETAATLVEDVTPIRAFSIAGNLLNMMAATVAQAFDLGGPAFTIDAACSSSLVATFEAITHLRAGLCDVALAGGVYLNLEPDNLVGFSRIGAISRSDACRPFDASADGFVLGEGVGAVVLKRLPDALRDGDRIYAVVRGAGINNDGRGDGPMTPRQSGQVDVLARAYRDGEVAPDTVGFIEAHGTATGVGDVVEVAALKEYYRGHAKGPIDCVLSSVKANIGHTMSAAGIAGLIKAALVVSERTIPPQAAYSTPHPALDLGGDFKVATEERAWPAAEGHPRRAAISSFGFGGTNCHLVLEEAPARAAAMAASAAVTVTATAATTAAVTATAAPANAPPAVVGVGGLLSRGSDNQPHPFVISAPTVELLADHLAALRASLADGLEAEASLADLAYTLSAARTRHAATVGFVARSRDELSAKLTTARDAVLAGRSLRDVWFAAAPRLESDRKVAFLFPGQGAQAVGLCRALYDRFPGFRVRLEALAAGLDRLGLLERPLLSYLYPTAPYDAEAAARALTRTEVCQPALAALGLALAGFLGELGVRPDVVMGHSLGEFVAAGAGGLLAPEAALRFVAERGRVMRDLALADAGAMVAIAADRETAQRHASSVDGVALANLNHPGQAVASGTSAGIEALMARLAAAGIQATRLTVSHAFHSPLMAGAREPLRALVERLEVRAPSVPVLSCIEPGPYAEASARRVFVEHATSPVDFVAGVRQAAAAGARAFVQVGAGSALLSMARATLAADGIRPLAAVSVAAAEGDDSSRFCEALVELAVAGVPVELARLFGAARPAWLPPTPLQTESYCAVSREERPPLPEVEVPMARSDGQSDALVALFREQMAVFAAQNEIIRKQTEALQGGARPVLATVSAPPAAVGVGGHLSRGSDSPAQAAGPAPAAAAAPATPAAAASKPASPPSAVVGVGGPISHGSDTPTPEIDDKLLDLVAAVSAFPRAGVKPEQRLVGDLGFDSLMVVELAGKADAAFPGLGTLPKSLFVNDPTVRDVARHIASALRDRERAPAAAQSAAGEVRRWRPAFVARPLTPPPPGAEPPFAGPVAIIPDAGGVAGHLARLLSDAGRATTTDLERAHGVIDLRGLDEPTGTPDSAAYRKSALAALSLARRGPLSLFAVAHSGLAHAALAGFAKALAREQPNARVKAVALPAGGDAEMRAALVFHELLTPDATVEVSYADGARTVVELQPAGPLAAAPLPDEVVVAISGGARGLGAKLAVELARRHRARLILLGRSAATPDVMRTVTAVKGSGGEAIYARCDVADPAAVAAALAEGRGQFGPIQVVVHAAGVIADAPAGKKTDEDFTRVFDTKVGGALALLAATEADPVRTFLIYSSWSGRFGNASQTDYSAANHLAGALAAAARPGRRVVALDLPPWEDSGMVRGMPDAVRAGLRAAGVTFLSDEIGLDRVVAELSDAAPSGEVLLGGDLEREQADVSLHRISLASHAYLDDHRVNGRPVLPLAAAADYALAAAGRVLGAPARLSRLELLGGVRLEADEVFLHVTATPTTVELATSDSPAGKRAPAYRCQVAPAEGPLPELAAPPVAEAPPLGVAAFYKDHTFHGPRLQGIVSVDGLGDAHVSGVVRAARQGEVPRLQLDPLLVDASFQLAAYWAIVKHGRAGLPLGIEEVRLLAPIPPGSEVRCLLLLEKSAGDLFTGHIDYRDASGRLVAQLRGVSAALAAERPAEKRIDPAYYQVEAFPEYVALKQRLDLAKAMGIANPYFNIHQRVTNNTSLIDGREVINFSSYNYLGLSGDEDVSRAVVAAVERYGTSVSASRVASGEKPITRELEAELARFLGCEDAIVMVGGHATNVSVIGHLLGPGDLILHDSLAHDSIMGGAKLSGARRRPFPHNDFAALDRTLRELRGQFKKVLIALEGTYSMDGDIPDLDEVIAVKKRHKAMLLVDEAHSFGVLGETGRGIGELYGVDRRDVELWMGTLSKSLASCGGYIAGSHALVEYLKYTNPGFVYSVGISPPNAASALAALRKLEAQPELVALLHRRARFFLERCRERGINTGMSDGSAVIPCIVGNSYDCLQLAQALGQRGINVQPILYPAVEEHLARLRFFMTARHTEEQLLHTVQVLAEELTRLNPAYLAAAAG